MTTAIGSRDVAEVRTRMLRYCSNTDQSYRDVAERCRLKPHQVADFACGRNSSAIVMAALCDHLPIGLVFIRAHILPE
jgi:hypothetical protein